MRKHRPSLKPDKGRVRDQMDAYKCLAAAILAKSVTDLLGTDYWEALDALMYWLWGDAQNLCEQLDCYQSEQDILLFIKEVNYERIEENSKHKGDRSPPDFDYGSWPTGALQVQARVSEQVAGRV